MLVSFFLIGLTIGSFINALIYRLPRSLGLDGRSMCPSCKSKIAWHDLIPLLSFVFLRGRCRKCAQRISFTYPLVELLTALIFLQFARSAVSSADNFVLIVFGLFALSAFITLLFIDLKYFILPDKIVFPLIFAAAIYLFTAPQAAKENLAGAILWGGIFGLIYWLSKGKWLGFGDVKLALAIGLIFGLFNGFFVIYFAILAGAAVSLTLLVSKKANMKTKIPFGAFLSGASIIFILFDKIIYNLLNLFI